MHISHSVQLSLSYILLSIIAPPLNTSMGTLNIVKSILTPQKMSMYPQQLNKCSSVSNL